MKKDTVQSNIEYSTVSVNTVSDIVNSVINKINMGSKNATDGVYGRNSNSKSGT